jgi:NTE family protein
MTCDLVLSGGGTRAYAHIGVVKALIEKGFEINAISGTSSGAIIGAFLCDGFHPDEIEEILLKYEPEIGINYTHFWENLLSFDAYAEVMRNTLRSKTFETLQKLLYVGVTDLNDGRQVTLHKGNLLQALIASAAIPVFFPVHFINRLPCADGGLSDNLPVKPFLSSSHKIIGVHANPISELDTSARMIHQLDRSLHLLMRNSVMNNMKHCDMFIEPMALRFHHLFESGKTKDLIRIGYDYVMQEIDISPLIL